MAELFILGRLRAAFNTVEKEIEAFATRFALDPWAGAYFDDVGIIPIEGMSYFPHVLRERWAAELNGGLFTDYVIGSICGAAYAASDTNCIDRFRDHVYTYGAAGRVVRMRWDPAQSQWIEIIPERDTRATEEKCGVAEEHAKQDGESDEDHYLNEVYESVDAEFETVGLSEWFGRQDALRRGTGVGAKLILVATRGDYTQFEATNQGQTLKRQLGQTASTVMRGRRVAFIAVRTWEKPAALYERVRRCLPPRLIEDFIIFDVGREVASRHTGLSPLASWIDRFIVRGEGAEGEEAFGKRVSESDRSSRHSLNHRRQRAP